MKSFNIKIFGTIVLQLQLVVLFSTIGNSQRHQQFLEGFITRRQQELEQFIPNRPIGVSSFVPGKFREIVKFDPIPNSFSNHRHNHHQHHGPSITENHGEKLAPSGPERSNNAPSRQLTPPPPPSMTNQNPIQILPVAPITANQDPVQILPVAPITANQDPVQILPVAPTANQDPVQIRVPPGPSIPISSESPVPAALPGIVEILSPPKADSSDTQLCPADTIGVHYRYYNTTQKCHKLGNYGESENPCGANMQLYPYPKNSPIYADCDCKLYVGCDYRPLVFYGNACYHLNSQGPCKPKEWLTISEKTSTAICSPRPKDCSENSTMMTTQEGNNKCYELGTPGNCKNPGEILQYSPDHFNVICSREVIKTPACSIQKSVSTGAPSLPCRPGQGKTNSGSCATLTGFA